MKNKIRKVIREEMKKSKLKEDNSPSIVSSLEDILKAWETKQYASDEERWKEYYKDIDVLVKKSKVDEGNKSLKEISTQLGYLKEGWGGSGKTTDGLTPEIKAIWDSYTYGDYKQGIRPKIGCCDGYEIMDHDVLTVTLDNDEALQSILSAMDEKTATRQRYQLGDALGFVLTRAQRMER